MGFDNTMGYVILWTWAVIWAPLYYHGLFFWRRRIWNIFNCYKRAITKTCHFLQTAEAYYYESYESINKLSMYPSRRLPPHEKTKSKGWRGSQLEPSEWAFNLTHGSACIIGWKSELLDIFISPYIAQHMGCVIGMIHCGLKAVFGFRHFTGLSS